MNYILNLKDITSKEDKSLTGGKAGGIMLIRDAGLNYPDTYVITSNLFKNFRNILDAGLSETEILCKAKNYIVNVIGEELEKFSFPKMAVRSSAVIEDGVSRSFAGMFKSILNVEACSLAQAIAEVWLSGLKKRISSYMENPFEWPEIAVIIQPLIETVLGGVYFSKHPAPGDVRDNEKPLIEFVTASGEKLVQGEITPFSAVNPFETFVASPEYSWMVKLEEGVKKLESSLLCPLDVEFAVDKEGRLWFLQQRPVTQLNKSNILLLENYRKAYKRTLCSLDIEFLIEGCSLYLAPYLELSLNLTKWMVMITNHLDGQQELWLNRYLDNKVTGLIKEYINNDISYLRRLLKRYEYYHRQILNWNRMLWADDGVDPVSRIEDFFEFALPLNAHYYVPMFIIESLGSIILEKMKHLDPEGAEEDFFKITTSGIITLAQLFNEKCYKLKEKILADIKIIPHNYEDLPVKYKDNIKKIVSNYGFLNCHLPSEEPYKEREIYNFVRDSIKEENISHRKIVLLEEKYKNTEQWKELLTYLRTWLNIRNQQMEYLYFIYTKARPLLKVVSEKLEINLYELWNLNKKAILNALYSNEKIEFNFKRNNLCLFYDGNKVFFGDDLKPVFASSLWDKNILKGRTVFGNGKIKGTVKIAFTPEELNSDYEENSVIVTGMTTPDFVPFLKKKAIALITDEGGILCHAAIIAREIKLPCIVGTGVATETLLKGSQVEIDLDTGKVKLLS